MIDLSKNAGFDLAARNRAERRFRLSGILAIAVSLMFLLVMLWDITGTASGAIKRTQIAIEVDLGAENMDPADLRAAPWGKIVKQGLRAMFPEVSKRKDKKRLYNLASPEAGFELRQMVTEAPELAGGVRRVWVTASDDLDLFLRGKVDMELPEKRRRVKDVEAG